MKRSMLPSSHVQHVLVLHVEFQIHDQYPLESTDYHEVYHDAITFHGCEEFPPLPSVYMY